MPSSNESTRVVVTGASGYIALHCVQQLLEAGYQVRGTVRSLNNEDKVAPLRRLPHSENLELVEADLMKADDWFRVLTGCDAVLHVASPWPIVADASTIEVAVTGTMNVLRVAAQVSSIRKVVLTSSCAAINDGHSNDERIFDESVWTNLESPKVDAYATSKTLAEKTAWDFWRTLPSDTKFQLTVLCPTFVTGPVLSSVEHGSATIIGRMMDIRTFLAAPKACLGVVDVRDVAKAHVLSLQRPETDGQRILVTQGDPVWFGDMVNWLAKEFVPQGYVITPIVAPNWLLRLYAKAKIDEQSTAVVHRIGPELRFDNSASKKLLGMTYIRPEDSVVEMMYSMIKEGMVKKPLLRKFPKKRHWINPTRAAGVAHRA